MIFLLILVSLMFGSPAIFAQNYSLPEDIVKENNQCPIDSMKYYNSTLPISEDWPVILKEDVSEKNFLNNLKDWGYYFVHFVNGPFSDEEKEFLKKNMGYLTKDAEFYTDYFDVARPFFISGIVQKSLLRGMRSVVFSTNSLKTALLPAESGVFINENLGKLQRNIYGLVKKAKQDDDYQEAGKIIKNSFFAQFMILPTQLGIGFSVPYFLKILGLPEEACDLAGDYLKIKSFTGPITELSDKTGDILLSFERKEVQWMLPLVRAFFTFASYGLLNVLLGPTGSAEQTVKRLAVGEIAGDFLTASSLLAYIYYDEAYDKYELFNFGFDDIDMETIKDIKESSMVSFRNGFFTTIATTMEILSLGLLGSNALGDKKDLDQFTLLGRPMVYAGSQATREIIENGRASDETKEEIGQKIRLGIIMNLVMAAPYFYVLGKAISHKDTNRKQLLSVSAVGLIIFAGQHAANQALAAFKVEEQNWLKTCGDFGVLVIPIIGYSLKRFGLIENSVKNHIIILLVSYLPSIANIASAWWKFGGNEQ